MKHPDRQIEKAVAIVGCKHTTKDLILGLNRYGYTIDHCLTIPPHLAETHQVAGYLDLRSFLQEKNIPYTLAHKYNLKTDEDRERLLSLNLDLLLVMGWQRLIPDWWIESLSIGAFGMHGSSKPLPNGRGRSPLNWSLIQNKNIFYTNLFKYQFGVDDGPIVGSQVFDITDYDTCLTLHFKNTIAMNHLCNKYLPSLLDGSALLSPQSHEGATYYPKRNAEDGMLYWEDTTLDLYNLIRAVTRPFPGAFTYLDNDLKQKVFIWQAMPFDTHLEWARSEPGDIVEVFYNGSFVVRTGNSTLLVTESEGYKFSDKDIGRRFGHIEQQRKIWEDLPD